MTTGAFRAAEWPAEMHREAWLPKSACADAILRSGAWDVALQSSSFPQDSAVPKPGRRATRIPNEADAELVRQMRAGDEGAFATFYDRYAPGLFSMIFAILHDQKESEDVLQESFVQMWKRTATYDASRSSLFTWAVMISRHKAIDRLRSRQRQSRLSEAVASEAEIASSFSTSDRADDTLERNDERERVRTALAELGEAQREAIDLAFFGGLTQTQIAERIGAPLGTVKARIRRGLLALREVLGGISS
ncbi:MAG: sigma-70 family RNA polymerase sigma factor [Spartobacteria bacterium]